jgi:hypothetical protein
MKVIFLDIDGVLNLNRKERDDYGQLFHDQFVENLDLIIKSTDAKIVISSTWRYSGLEIMKEMWTKRNLPGEVIDTTPCIYEDKSMVRFFNGYKEQHPTPKTFGVDIPRGIEIDYWLSNIGKFQRITWDIERQQEYLDKALVKNYVILDDDSDMLLSQAEHFVKCSGNNMSKGSIEGYGLTPDRANKAIEILNSSIIDLYYDKILYVNERGK